MFFLSGDIIMDVLVLACYAVGARIPAMSTAALADINELIVKEGQHK
jgi:hypothetical protein